MITLLDIINLFLLDMKINDKSYQYGFIQQHIQQPQ